MTTFVVYGKDNCQYCSSAKKMLEVRKQDFVYKSLNEDYSVDDLKGLAKAVAGVEVKTFPQIFLLEGDKIIHIGGFEETMKFLNK